MTALAVDYEGGLVEAAVLARLRGLLEERPFWRERDRLYQIADGEAREAGFAALHGAWFGRLGLDRSLRQALAERPELDGRCARAIVARAMAPRDEAADLLVAPPALPTLFVRLRVATLSDAEQALRLLRHELLHVADMLAPAFGYAPRLPPSPEGPLRDRRVAERYRALWDAYVDGRLARTGRAPAEARAERLMDFAGAFPELENPAAAFARFFDGADLTHADLAAFAQGPDRPARRWGRSPASSAST